MPTINSMVQRNNLLANVSHRYFKLDMDAADKSVLVGGAIRTSANFLKSDFGGQPALTNLVENYSADREDFQSQMQDKLISLQESSDKLKTSVQEEENSSASETSTQASSEKTSEVEGNPTLSTLENFAKGNVPPRAKILSFQPQTKKVESDNNEKIEQQIEKMREENLKSKNSDRNNVIEFAKNYLESDEKSEKNMQIEIEDGEKVSAVKSFVREFNSTLSYLEENSSISNKVSTLASNFNNSEKLNPALREIGISITSSGKLSVNEKILEYAIEKNPEAVTMLLGDGGLAGQLDRVLGLANNQGENLFPTINEYSGAEEFEAWENLYSAQNFMTANYAQEKSGKILNMFS